MSPWFTLILFYGLAVFLVMPPFIDVEFQEGEIRLEPIVADFHFTVSDVDLNRKRRSEAENSHHRVYVYDPDAKRKTIGALDSIMKKATEVSAESITPEEKSNELSKWLKGRGVKLEPEQLDHLLDVADLYKDAPQNNFLNKLTTFVTNLYQDRGIVLDKKGYAAHYSNGLVEWKDGVKPNFSVSPVDFYGYPTDFQNDLLTNLKRFSGDTSVAEENDQSDTETHEPDTSYEAANLNLMQSLIEQVVVCNVRLDQVATRKRFEAELLKLGTPEREFRQGDIIIDRRAEVRDDVVYILDEYKRLAHQVNWMRLIANALYVFIVFVLIVYFIKKYQQNLPFTARSIVMLILPIASALIIGRLSLVAMNYSDYAPYLFPAALIGMVGVIIIGPRSATLLVLLGCMLFGAAVDFDFRFVAVGLFGGLTAVASLYKFRERRDVYVAGLQVGVANFVSVFIINFIQEPLAPEQYVVLSLIGLGNGIACAAVTPFFVGVFEWTFGMVTDMRLLELSGIRHKVLREIEERIPGTWQHSLNVAKLAEDAANAIGANYLLVRTGAYYHDIGKLDSPKYFSENQDSIDDKKKHSKLMPSMSVLIIKSHVKKGIELAQSEGLPQQVIDFIPQHHGTCLIKYFYTEAKRRYEEGDLSVQPREEDFRYDGPKPQTIETAILMLADSVEATATAVLAKPTVIEEEIVKVVHDTVVDKFNDGQFDECDLTLRDLHLISESFTKTLMSRFHHRVQYPRIVKKDEEKKKDAPAKQDSRGNGLRRDEEARRPAHAGNEASKTASSSGDLKVLKS